MSEGLILTDASVRFGRREVLRGFSLPPLRPGEVTVLAGPNGAGKSTLLKGIARLAPVGGEMILDGRPIAEMRATERAAQIGFMPQTLPAAGGLCVLDCVIAALRAGGVASGSGAETRAFGALERLGISDLAMEPLERLSGGQRQMVSLAQASVREPRLLLLDEPTSALDPAAQVRLLREVRRIAAEGRIVLAVLHDLALAARWADRIAVLHQGRLYGEGTPTEVLTPAMMAEVYGVAARVERCSRGSLMVMIDDERGRG